MKVPESKINELKYIFQKMDVNGNGKVDEQELVSGMKEFNQKAGTNIEEAELIKIFR